MKIQILPNWYKKIGLILFIIASLLNGSLNFLNTSQKVTELDNGIQGLLNAFSGGALNYGIDFVAIIAMLIFMASKEKVEDDYIDKLRLESFQFTFIIGLLVTILMYVFAKDLKLTLNFFIFPLLWSYIVVFFIKRKMYL
ncbi:MULTISPECIES: hypothetical protein [unclassified Tenacibaculum]|uniref:hypothetical protein n=1 Tax=unclassified Tenacibaculum TaxID=2635139 RepID=UPI001F3FF618|nr:MULTISPECIES: hypothetical protein [unclassified Tenacibaculum]MCF2873358.1 hypothetical protein [Tenacibaculum sp. Cn5-1]MCF2933514.1 hypothetical protein [Tenacibaculum sp. Cn5-34]MCG7509904.1 hypothetical protein [Tenacibaculum sp. Cn5-46]